MTDGLAMRIVLAARPKGKPLETDFRIEKLPIPKPRQKELLLQTRYLSLDPYMRGLMDDKKSYTIKNQHQARYDNSASLFQDDQWPR
jgi:NADPH-dependent curcumin reductase